MKTFAMLLLVLLFFCRPVYLNAQEFDVLIDVSDSVTFSQKEKIRQALAEMGEQTIQVIPWSSHSGQPYVMSGKDAAEYFQFSGGSTNPHVALEEYFKKKPVCRKIVLMIDGVNEGLQVPLELMVRKLIQANNLVMIVELSHVEYRNKWYQGLLQSESYFVFSFRLDILTPSFQNRYSAPTCMG